MGKIVQSAVVLAALALLALGCGVADDDFQAGNRLLVVSVLDDNGNATPNFPANEETDDSGQDGEPNTGDVGEGDGFPDPQETLIQGLTSDVVTMTLQNETRLGVDPGLDLQLFRVDVTYYDANGAARDFAPRFSYQVSGTVPVDGTVDVPFTLVPASMKVPATGRGLRAIFLTPQSAEELASVEHMTAVIDVYARDVRNNDTVHAQSRVTVFFYNPMVVSVGGQ